jgi:hypothetical protein
MRYQPALLALTLLMAPLTGCQLSVDRQFAPAAACQEDEPCWDCTTDGNKVCGTPSPAESAAAWKVWDYSGGAHKLTLDPSRPFRVDYVGRYSSVPNTGTGEVALLGKDGDAYLFRVRYTTPGWYQAR